MLAINGGVPVRKTPLYYGHQYIDQDDIDAVTQVLKSDYLTCGPKIPEAEKHLCSITGANYTTVLSNGTAALHAACYAAGIDKDDEVITSPITFAASANCVLYCGARPIFADICSDTYNISPDAIRRNITKKTKAVIAVDFTGQAAELDEIRDICDEFGLIFIEDAAHSIGTKYNGKTVGSIADLTTFSFHPVKTVTSGEGGAVATNQKKLYDRLQLFRAHGITRDSSMMANPLEGSWYYEQISFGYNYRMTDIQAALLISQLNKLDLFSNRRKQIVELYNQAFQNMPEVILQAEIPQSNTVRHLYLLRLNLTQLKVGRQQVYEALKAENIYCNVHYIPVYYFPYYQSLGYQKGLCPEAESFYEQVLTLPLYYAMSDNDVSDAIHAVKKVLEYYRK